MATITSDIELPQVDMDNTADTTRHRAPLVLGHDFKSLTDRVAGLAERPASRMWKICFTIALIDCIFFFTLLGYSVLTGVGVWGTNIPNGWAFPIINFVFWVGIGHAGTLISAILYLFRQQWRTGINRMAEAMTIFAVCCAGIFPAIHVGRPWLAYWLFPVPNQMDLWPQFRSPLMWDVFAVSTYATVSLLFWYVGMVPDLATLRDRAKTKAAQIGYGIFSLGWNGSTRHWLRFEKMYLLLAALATPLVLSVHSVVSFDFAVSLLPGWHETIFPPYFVSGAIYGGFAMVLCLAVPARYLLGLKDIITERHIDIMCKIMMATGMMVGYAYGIEFFIAWFSGHHFEEFIFSNRVFGPYAWAFWLLMWCNVCCPQMLWFKKFRTNPWLVMMVATFANVGMWFERFVITIGSLHRDFLPGFGWALYYPSWVDVGILIGSFGLFFTLFLLFCKYLPVVAMAEVKTIMPEAHTHGSGEDYATAARNH